MQYHDNPWLNEKIKAQVEFQNLMQNGGGSGSLDDLKGLVNGDQFFYARLPSMVNDVRNGDYFFLNQNWATDPDIGRVRNMISTYSSLLDNGYTNAEIMGHLYDMDGSSWSSWDTNPPDKTSTGEYINPADDPDGNTPSNPTGPGGSNPNPGGFSWGTAGQSGSAWGKRRPQDAPYVADQFPQQDTMGPQPNQNRLFSPENEQMRKIVADNLKNRLFGG